MIKYNPFWNNWLVGWCVTLNSELLFYCMTVMFFRVGNKRFRRIFFTPNRKKRGTPYLMVDVLCNLMHTPITEKNQFVSLILSTHYVEEKESHPPSMQREQWARGLPMCVCSSERPDIGFRSLPLVFLTQMLWNLNTTLITTKSPILCGVTSTVFHQSPSSTVHVYASRDDICVQWTHSQFILHVLNYINLFRF